MSRVVGRRMAAPRPLHRVAKGMLVLLALGGIALATVLDARWNDTSRPHSVTAGETVSTRAGTRALGVPFALAGLRIQVLDATTARWGHFAGRSTPAPGRRWKLVAVRVTNLRRTHFDPHVLHYRIVDARGATYLPDPTRGTGRAVHRPPQPLARGKTTEVKLVFSVPKRAGVLRLRFDPSTNHHRVEVVLGR